MKPAGLKRCRTFIALPISPDFEKALKTWLARWAPEPRGIKWSTPEQWHFTLAFLGDLPCSRLPAVSEACWTAARQTPPFVLKPAEFGLFPPRGAGKVLWLGVSQGAREMAALQGKVAASLQHLGFALEARAFVPHLTLGRARTGHAITLDGVPDAAELQAVEVAAREIRVMRSDLSAGGAKYSVLEYCPFSVTDF